MSTKLLHSIFAYMKENHPLILAVIMRKAAHGHEIQAEYDKWNTMRKQEPKDTD